MPPMMISRRILGCLLLILLLQSGNALKSKHLETVLSSLDRIENAVVKQAQQNALSCIIPFEKLYKLISDLTKTPDEEIVEQARRGLRIPHRSVDLLNEIRKALEVDDDFEPFFMKKDGQRGKNKEMNTDAHSIMNAANMNTNMNTNTNINADQFRSRRTLDNKVHNINSNFNMNSNFNRNRKDYSDEDEAK